MTAPCPRCGASLRPHNPPGGLGLTQCPVSSCAHKLVFTADKFPFDPAQHGFTLRDWEEYQAEPVKFETTTFGERVLARIVPAALCGFLTAMLILVLLAYTLPDWPIGPPFVIAFPISTLGYLILYSRWYVRSKQGAAKLMRYFVERLQREGVKIEMRAVDVDRKV